MDKLRMKVGKINCILWNNHLFFQWHGKRKTIQNAPWKAILGLFFWQDTESAKIKSVNSVLWREGKKAIKTVEALKTRLTSVQTARRIFMHYLYHSKCKFCLALITIHVSKIFLQLWHNSNNAEAEEKGNCSHFGQDQLAHPCPLTVQGITHILTNPQRAGCSTTVVLLATENFPDISLMFSGSASIPCTQ